MLMRALVIAKRELGLQVGSSISAGNTLGVGHVFMNPTARYRKRAGRLETNQVAEIKEFNNRTFSNPCTVSYLVRVVLVREKFSYYFALSYTDHLRVLSSNNPSRRAVYNNTGVINI